MADWPEDYLRGGQAGIEGWLHLDALMLLLGLHRIQREHGTAGAVAEIGVHHGRLFLALALLRDAAEQAIAVDVFERQDLNPDRSGRGDRAAFEANLAAWGAAARTHILARDSLTLAAEEIQALAGPPGVRLFSVDGSHTFRHATNDLRLAEACLAPGGAILLDDWFHAQWPEVTEAGLIHLRGGESRVLPVALAGMKLVLVRREEHAAWLDRLEHRVRRYATTWTPIRIAGTACIALGFPQRDGLLAQVGRPTRAQRLGAPAVLDFQGVGPDPARLGEGWGPQERWGRWTAGPEAGCRIPLPPGLEPRRLVLDIGMPGAATGQESGVGIEVAGRAVTGVTLRGPMTGAHVVDLPPLPAGRATLDVVLRPQADRIAVLAIGVFG